VALAEATVRVVLDVSRFDNEIKKIASNAGKQAGREFDKEFKSSISKSGKDAMEDFRTAARKGSGRAGRDAGDEFDKQFRQGTQKTGGLFSSKLANIIRLRLGKAGVEAGDAFSVNVVKTLGDAGGDAGNRFADRIGETLETRAGDVGARFANGLKPNLVAGAGSAGDASGKSFGSRLLGAVSAVIPKVRTVVVAGLAAGLVAGAAALINFTSAALPAAQAIGIFPTALFVTAGALGVFKLAFENFGNAIKAAGLPAAAFEKKLRNLAPAAADVATEYRKLLPAFSGIRKEVQQTFFGQLHGQLTKMSSALAGPLRSGLVQAAAGAGSLTKQLTGVLAQSRTGDALRKIFGSVQSLFVKLGPGLAQFLDGVIQIAAALTPLFDRMATALSLVIGKFGLFLQKNAANGKALEWAEKGFDVLHQLWQIFKDLIGILGAFFRAGRAAGDDYLGRLHTMLQRTKAFLQSAQGQDTLIRTFRAIGDVIHSITPVFKELFLSLGRIAPVIAQVTRGLARGLTVAIRSLSVGIQNAAPGLRQFANAVGDFLVNIGPDLESLGTSLGKLLKAAAALLPTLTAFVHITTALFKAFTALPGPVQSAVLALLVLSKLDVFTKLRAFGKDAQSAGGAVRKMGQDVNAGTNAAGSAARRTQALSEALRNMRRSFVEGTRSANDFGKILSAAAGAKTADFMEGVSSAASKTRIQLQALANRGSIAIDNLARRLAFLPLAADVALTGLKLAPSQAMAAFNVLSNRVSDAASAISSRLQLMQARASIALENLSSRVVATGRAIPGIATRIVAAFAGLDSGVRGSVERVAGAIITLPERVGNALTSLQNRIKTAAVATGTAAASLPGRIQAGFANLTTTLAIATNRAVAAIEAIPRATVTAASGVRQGVSAISSSVSSGLGALAGAIRSGVVTSINQIPTVVARATATLGTLAAPLGGVVKSLGTGLKAAATGLVGALGGPWGIAIAGASILLSQLGAANEAAAQKEREHQSQVQDLAQALKESNGAITEAIRQKVGETLVLQYGDATKAAKTLGIGLDTVTTAAIQQGPALDQLRQKLMAIIAAHMDTAKVDGSQIKFDDAGAQAAYDLLPVVNQLSGSFRDAQQANNDMNASISAGTASMLEGTSSGQKLGDAMKTLSDHTASADDRTRALKDALDALNGGEVDLQTAQSQMFESLDKLNGQLKDGATNSKGYAKSLFDAKGNINLTTAGGRELFASLKEVSTSTFEVAQRTYDMTGSLDAAKSVVQESRNKFIEMATAMGIPAEEAKKLANQMGLIPGDIETVINLTGGTPVQAELELIRRRAQEVPNAKSIHVSTLSKEAEAALKAVGISVNRVPGGKDIILTALTGTFNSAVNQAQKPGRKIIELVPKGGRALGSFNMALGGVLSNAVGRVMAFASGGLNPLPGGRASVVPPNTWRVIGDRMTGDELYLPLDRSSRSKLLLAYGARRMGFSLLADGGVSGVTDGSGGAGRGLTIAEGAIVIRAPYADPALVAKATVNELAKQASL
jgi:hypothetical protein